MAVDLGGIADYLGRVVHQMPASPHYVREKASNLARAAIGFSNRVHVPAILCNHEIVTTEIDEDNGKPYTIHSGCGRAPGHDGDHLIDSRRDTLISTAEYAALAAHDAAQSFLWTLGNGSDLTDPETNDFLNDRIGQAIGHLQSLRQAITPPTAAELANPHHRRAVAPLP